MRSFAIQVLWVLGTLLLVSPGQTQTQTEPQALTQPGQQQATPNPPVQDSPIKGTTKQVPVPPLTGHVIDQTNTLTESQQMKIEQALAGFEVRKGSQLAVLLVASTQPETIEQYALRVAEQWQLGRKKVDDGAILVVAKNDRTLRIEVGYGLEGALNDATSKRIIEEIITPQFRQQNFAGGITGGLDRMMAVIDGEPLPAPGAGASADPWGQLAWILAAGATLGFVLRMVLGRFPGALMTGAIVGTVTWFLLGALTLALIAGLLTWVTTWIGLGALLQARYGRGGPGGGPGGLGGGFKGGGGGFGGGGASGRW